MARKATVGTTVASVEKGFVSSGSLVPTVLLLVLRLVITIMPRVFGLGRTLIANVDLIQSSGSSEDGVFLEVVSEGGMITGIRNLGQLCLGLV